MPVTRRSLNFDFVRDGAGQGFLDPLWTFTRASTATRINASGEIETVAANVPRFDFDPVTLECRGLLIEEARTNHILHSNDFTNAAWTKLSGGAGSVPVVTAGQPGPNGLAASRLQLNAGGATGADYSVLNQSLAGFANPHPAAGSIWIKSNTGGTQVVSVVCGNTGFLVNATTAWQRLSCLVPAVALTTDYFQIRAIGGVTATSLDLLIAGAQFETATFVTSYIPTTTAVVTRSADNCSIAGAALSPWFNVAAGTWFVDWNTFTPDATFPVALNPSYDADNYMLLYRTSSGNVRGEIRTGGVVVAGFNVASAYSYGVRDRAAMSYLVNAIKYSANGSVVQADTSATLPPAPANIYLGTFNGSTNRLSGHIRRLVYLPFVVDDLTLRAMTQN